MNAKLKAILSRVSWLRWIFIYLGLAVVAAVIAAGTWVALQPLDKYKARAVAEIKKATQAQSVSIKNLQWDYSLKSFSFGLHASQIELEGLPKVEKLTVPHLRVFTQPLKVLFGRFPAQVVMQNPHIKMRAPKTSEDSEGAPSKVENLETTTAPVPPRWLKFLRLNFELTEGEIGFESAPGESSTKESAANIEKINVKAVVAGYPGSFDVDVSSHLNFDLGGGRWIAQGEVQSKAAGYFQLEAGRPMGIKLETFHVDLNELNFVGLGHIEKTSKNPLEFSSQLQILLKPDQSISSVEVVDGVLRYDELPIALDCTYKIDKGLSAKWMLNRTEVKDFHAPLAMLRQVPLTGMLESSGAFNFFQNSDVQGSWKFGLNNLRIQANELENIAEKSSTGEIIFSLVSEGSLEHGHLNSPRTEIQLNGTGASISFADDAFVKPAGDAMELILKADIRDDNLNIRKLNARLHNVEVEGSGELNRLYEIFSKRQGFVKLNLRSNRVDLSKWGSYIKMFKKPPPLEGFMELAGSVEGPVSLADDFAKTASWRIDRLNLSNVRASFSKESFMAAELQQKNYLLNGMFLVNFIFQGRGVASRIDQASLLSHIDFSKVAILYKDQFRKPAGVPFFLDINAQQSRNQIMVKRGQFRFHTLDLDFSGKLVQGSTRSAVELAMKAPVNLSDWREFFLSSPDVPVDGKIIWKGRLGFPQNSNPETDLDWRDLSLEGSLRISDLNGKFGQMRNPLRAGNGLIQFQSTGLSIPQFNVALGKTIASFSGEMTALNRSAKKQMTLNQLFGQKAWDVSAQLSLNRLSPEDFASTTSPQKNSESADANSSKPAEERLGDELRSLLNNPLVKQSRIKLMVRARDGNFGQIQYQNLNMRALWENAAFKMQPFSLEAFKGKLSGSVLMDATPFYLRKESPSTSATLKVSGLDTRQIASVLKPEMAKTLGGTLSGDLTLTTEGFEANEMIQKSKGRLTGNLKNGEFESLQFLKASLDALISNSEAKDLLLKQASKEKCIQKNFDATIDSQLRGGQIELEAGQLNFQTGSRIEMKGKIEKDLKVNFAGDFLPGAECIGGDALQCLKGSGLRAAIPFKLEGPASDAKASLNGKALASTLTQCLTRGVAKKAQQAIQKELLKVGPSLQDQAKEKLKKIFK